MKLIERLANIPRASYRFYLDDKRRGPDSLMHSFLDMVVPAIRTLAYHVTSRAAPVVKRFTQVRKDVEDCLRVGVVPHTTTSNPPDPVSIINSAFFFYLTSLPMVISEFEKPEDQNNVAVHSRWTKRLEMWTMKAVEDSQIQDRFRRMKGTALWSFLVLLR